MKVEEQVGERKEKIENEKEYNKRTVKKKKKKKKKKKIS